MNWTIRRTLIVSVALLCVTAISIGEASAGWRLRGGRCRGARVYQHTCCTNDGYRSQRHYGVRDHFSGNGYYRTSYSQGGYGGGYTTNGGFAQNNCGCNPINSGSTRVDNANGYGSSQPMTNGQTWTSGQVNQPETLLDIGINPNVVDRNQTQRYSAPTGNLLQSQGDSTATINKQKE